MAAIDNVFRSKSDAVKKEDRLRPIRTPRFDWAMVALSAWFLGGLFLDGWAHTHGQVDDSFFTPWHAVLYSGHLAVTIFLAASMGRNVLRGYTWRKALPAGYGLSLLGAVLFGIAGVGDLIWHTLFGIEENVEALLSPTHLLLAGGGLLIFSGPLRAAWRASTTARGLRDQLPMLLSLAATLSVVTFFTQMAFPLANLWGVRGGQDVAPLSAWWERELGVVSILLDTALLMGAILLLLRRWPLAPGALTLIFTINAVLMGFLYDAGVYPVAQVIARSAAGLVADVLLQRLQPSPQRPGALRSFTVAVPVVVYGLYFVTAQLTAGVSWSIHLWAGSIAMSGVAGLLLGFIAAPPQVPQNA